MAEEREKAPEQKEFDAATKELGDKIAALTLKQAVDLGEYLKAEYGIEPAAGAAVLAAPGGGAEAVAEVEEKTSFDAILKEIGEKKIQVIKVVRSLTNLGLKEAKDLVEGAPKPVKQGVSKEEAEEAVKQLTEAGAVAEVV